MLSPPQPHFPDFFAVRFTCPVYLSGLQKPRYFHCPVHQVLALTYSDKFILSEELVGTGVPGSHFSEFFGAGVDARISKSPYKSRYFLQHKLLFPHSGAHFVLFFFVNQENAIREMTAIPPIVVFPPDMWASSVGLVK